VNENKKEKVLEVIKVDKIYSSGLYAVRNINFDVYKGDFFALLGPNGAGKSTTLGMISSLVNKTSGSIKICGFDINKEPALARRSLGVMPQEINLNIFETPLDILINQAGFFGIPRATALPRALKLLNDMALSDKSNTQIRFLSGGMKRRVMVARALVHEPKLLILDEPTSGVDVELRQSIWAIMRRLNKKGLTIILTTHYLEEAESMCNRVTMIHKGKVHTSTDMKSFLRSIGTEVFVFDLKSPILNMSSLISDLGRIKLVDDISFEIEVNKSITLNRVFEVLNARNIEVISVRNKTNKLEKLFTEIAKG
jgi:ABC-2 type transport system ATP-binding protein